MATETTIQKDPDLQKLSDLIKDIAYAMLTTQEEDGTLHSRPMHTESMEPDGRLFFITSSRSAKALEIRSIPQVSLTYMSKNAQACVAIAGHGEVVRDEATIKRLWKPLYKAWFPKGIDDPNVAVLKVTIDRAEYWESPSSLVTQLFGAAKAVLTGEPAGATVGIHRQINW